MTTYLIVDDEPLAHDLIVKFCGDLPHMQLKKQCYNAMEAMEFLSAQQVDLMFLDLNMPRMSGFDFLRTLTNPPSVIVTTAYKEYALEGYELNVADYLLKPFTFARFVKAINKAVTTHSSPTPSSSTEKKKHFFVKGDKKYNQVNLDELLFVEAYGNYTRLYINDEIILCHDNISSLEETLPSQDFLRVHKSFMVAIDKIKSIMGNRIQFESHEVPIGQTYKREVTKLMG